MKLLKLNSGNSARQNFPSHDQARICHGENEDGQNVKVFSGWSACTEYLMEKLESFQMPSLCVFVLLLNVSLLFEQLWSPHSHLQVEEASHWIEFVYIIII